MNNQFPKIDVFFVVEITVFLSIFLSVVYMRLVLYVKSNVVKLMFIALFQFHVCYHDGV